MADIDFWMARFDVDVPALRTLLALVTATRRDAIPDELVTKDLLIEVLRFNTTTPRYAVLLSTMRELSQDAARLRTWLAFCDDVEIVDSYRRAGVPMQEAALAFENQRLVVTACHYPPLAARGRPRLVAAPFCRIDGIVFDTAASPKPYRLDYDQLWPRADPGRPGFDIVGQPLEWPASLLRAELSAPAEVTLEPSLFPDLATLFPDGPPAPPSGEALRRVTTRVTFNGSVKDEYALAANATGASTVPPPTAQAATTAAIGKRTGIGPLTPGDPIALTRAGIVAEPHFRFEHVELIGFRIDLPAGADDAGKVADRLAGLIRPLNFHRPDHERWRSDFEYRVATRSIVIELLRYGRMGYRQQQVASPLTEFYMAQHELLARVLVGRVDDGTAQAREPAVHVPAIFVDNPVSKTVGREMQGFEKRLAHFYRGKQRLSDDGTPVRPTTGQPDPASDGTAASAPVRLGEIDKVCLARYIDIGAAREPEDPLLEIAYSVPPPSGKDLLPIDSASLAGAAALARLRWRQDDFADTEFRRSFARTVVGNRFSRIRSVQAVPLDAGKTEARAWITGEYTLSNVRFQRPSGIATLTVHAAPESGDGWRQLRDLLVLCYGTDSVSLPSGDWYHAMCDMDLSIDDGLAW